MQLCIENIKLSRKVRMKFTQKISTESVDDWKLQFTAECALFQNLM